MASPSVQEAKSDNRERLGVHPFPIRRMRSVYTVREILNFSRTYVIDDLVFRHVAESVQSRSAERLVVLAELKISFDEIGGPGIETRWSKRPCSRPQRFSTGQHNLADANRTATFVSLFSRRVAKKSAFQR